MLTRENYIFTAQHETNHKSFDVVPPSAVFKHCLGAGDDTTEKRKYLSKKRTWLCAGKCHRTRQVWFSLVGNHERFI